MSARQTGSQIGTEFPAPNYNRSDTKDLFYEWIIFILYDFFLFWLLLVRGHSVAFFAPSRNTNLSLCLNPLLDFAVLALYYKVNYSSASTAACLKAVLTSTGPRLEKAAPAPCSSAS